MGNKSDKNQENIFRTLRKKISKYWEDVLENLKNYWHIITPPLVPIWIYILSTNGNVEDGLLISFFDMYVISLSIIVAPFFNLIYSLVDIHGDFEKLDWKTIKDHVNSKKLRHNLVLLLILVTTMIIGKRVVIIGEDSIKWYEMLIRMILYIFILIHSIKGADMFNNTELMRKSFANEEKPKRDINLEKRDDQ